MAQFLQIKRAKAHGRNKYGLTYPRAITIKCSWSMDPRGCSGRQWKPQSLTVTACWELGILYG